MKERTVRQSGSLPIGHVSDTAFLVAQYRAAESLRPDALFHDPFAARLAGKKGAAIGRVMNRPLTAWSITLRTVIIDALVYEAIAAGIDTVLSLGAGLDSRAYRLDLPANLLWIEADYHDVIAYKGRVLEGENPRCKLESVSIDLADDQQRRQFLKDVAARSNNLLVLTEGVIVYLENDQVGTLADDLRKLSEVTRVSWIVEYLPKSIFYGWAWRQKRQMKKAPFKFKPADWFAFFSRHGWQERTIRYLGIEGRHLGRHAPLSWRGRLLVRLGGILRRGKNPDRHDHLFGYAVLEPALIKSE